MEDNEALWCAAAASIWFEIWGVVDPGKKNRFFPGKFPRNFDFFRHFHEKFLTFPGKFLKNFNFFRQFLKNFDFPGKNCSFTATSEQIILFLFKSHHSNILPVHDKI